MNFLSLVKRVAPFVLTFAVGLFVASFFVTVAAPSFQFDRGFRRHRECERRMQFENRQLREENDRLMRQLQEANKRDWVLDESLDLPAPPPPPTVIKPVMPMKTVPSRAR